MLINLTIYCTSLFVYLQHEIKNFEVIIPNRRNRFNVQKFKNMIELHKEFLELSRRLDEFCSFFLFIYHGSFVILTCLLCNDIIMVSRLDILHIAFHVLYTAFSQFLDNPMKFITSTTFASAVTFPFILFSYYATEMAEKVRHKFTILENFYCSNQI